jgi:hypothetical protein
MGISDDTWRKIYAAFDPTARVEFDEADLFVGRPGTIAMSIVDDLRLGLEPQGKWVVCGAMGSGKSSELVELARRLDESHAVIGLDLPRSVTRVELLQPAEVLYLIGLAAIRTARDRWQQDIAAPLVDELHESFKPLLGQHARAIDPREILQGVALLTAHVASAATGAGPAVVGAVTGAARAVASVLPGKATLQRGTPLGGSTRPAVEGDPDIERLCAAVNAILEELAQTRQPIVLVDGLDKIQELKVIRDLFSGNRLLSLPRAPVVYTGPITLMLGTDWQATGGFFRRERLTNVVVRIPGLPGISIDSQKVEAGAAAMREVVSRRLRRVDLGVDDLFTPNSLDKLVVSSGGLLRDLIHLVQRAVRWCIRSKSIEKISELAADEAILELRREYEITLNTRRVDELLHVARVGEPSGDKDVSSELLLTGYILPYANGRVWFEPHPILRGLRPGL